MIKCKLEHDTDFSQISTPVTFVQAMKSALGTIVVQPKDNGGIYTYEIPAEAMQGEYIDWSKVDGAP